MRSSIFAGSVAPVLLMLSACSGTSESPSAKTKQASPEPVTGQFAFHRMFIDARSWSTDAQPIRLAQIDVDEVKAEGGKAGAWEAVFVSHGLGRIRRYIFSVIHRPARNLRGGVTSDPPERWFGGGGAEPFLVQAFKTDSPAAYEVARKHAREYVRKHPGQPVKFLLEKTKRFVYPTWRVYWGESVATSGFSVFVDAMTGEFLTTAR